VAVELGYISCHLSSGKYHFYIRIYDICTVGKTSEEMGKERGGWEERSIYTGNFQPLECASFSFQGYYEA